MKLKIGEIAKRSGIPASTIRYYVREGLLPRPRKVNEKMAYYDEACIGRLRTIQELQTKRYFPLYLIKNILRRMDEGLSLAEAETVENAVFGSDHPSRSAFVDRTALLAATGLTEKNLQQAESIGLLIATARDENTLLYNLDDIRAGKDILKRIIDLGIELTELAFFVELGEKIVDKEMAIRRRIVADKSTKDNIRLTAELTRADDFYRDYILRRLFQRQVEQNIQKSLKKIRKYRRKNVAVKRY